MAQMTGQDKKTFDEAGHQNREQNQRNGANKLPHHAGNQQHGDKRRQSSQGGSGNRHHHS